MKWLLPILLSLATVTASARKADMEALHAAIATFDKALINKDSATLKQLLSGNLGYGHSNGWVETKEELIQDLYNGKLTYKKIQAEAPHISTQGRTASARFTVEIDCVLDGRPMSFKLKVLQVWVWQKRHWELFARQSVSAGKDK